MNKIDKFKRLRHIFRNKQKIKYLILMFYTCPFKTIYFLLKEELNIFINHFTEKNNKKRKQLLIIRFDAIGDYILFRNFLEVIRNSEKYKNYEITFLGNPLFKDLSERFDNKYVDRFIWLNMGKFIRKRRYKRKIIRKLNKMNFATILSPVYDRDPIWVDEIVSGVHAKEKIGSTGSLHRIGIAQKGYLNKCYTKLIKEPDEPMFEFLRTKTFFEKVLDTNINIQKPYFDIDLSQKMEFLNNKYIILSPGSGCKDYRQWSTSNFAKVVDFISENYNLDIVLSGGNNKTDKARAEEIINKSSANIINLTGKLSLDKIPKLFAHSELIIASDTGAYHIGVAVNTNVICVSQGNTFVRFIPYPKEVYDKVYYAFPDEIDDELKNNYQSVVNKYYYISTLNLNKVSADKVIKIIQSKLY